MQFPIKTITWGNISLVSEIDIVKASLVVHWNKYLWMNEEYIYSLLSEPVIHSLDFC